MGMIGPGAEEMRNSDANAAGKHHEAAAEPVYENHGEHGEDQVNGAGDDDVEKYVVGSVAGTAIHLGGVIEKDVDAGPLLERSESDAHEKDFAERGKKKFAPGGFTQ